MKTSAAYLCPQPLLTVWNYFSKLVTLNNMKQQLALCFLAFFMVATSFAQKKENEAITKLLNTYKSKIEMLDTVGIVALFVPQSKVIEQGKDEGTIGHYLEHHLGPELKEFKAFKFNNYKVDINVIGNYAYTNESYGYNITTKDGKETKSLGQATSIMQKIKGEWKIVQSHSSFRRAK